MHLLIPTADPPDSISKEYLNSIPRSLQFISKIGNTILRYRVDAAAESSKTAALQPQLEQCFENSFSLSSTRTSATSQKRFRTKSEMVRNRRGERGGELLHSRTLSEPTVNKLIPRPKMIEELKLDLGSLEFWKNGIPIHIDIYSRLPNAPFTCYLLERWVLSFQQSTSSESLGDGAQSPSSFSLHDDMTDLILLIQSLYAEIRSLPLASALAQNSVKKGDLAFGISFAHGAHIKYTSSFKSDDSQSAERSFHPNAKLAVFKFRPAAAPLGNLCMHVVHDLNLAGLCIPSPTSASTSPTSQLLFENTRFRRNISPPSLNLEHLDVAGLKLYDRERKRRPSSGAGSIISAGSFVISPNTDRNPNHQQQDDANQTTSPTYDHQLHQNSGKLANSPGSPFPSPKAQKRVLSFAHSSSSSRQEISTSFASSNSSSSSSKAQKPIPPPIRIRSNLQFNFSFHSSSSDGPEEAADDMLGDQRLRHTNGEDLQILTPDGIEIHRSSLPTDSPISSLSPSGVANKRLVSRRDSLPSTASDLFGTFVGSYEESILIGRLSTSPSRPVPFLAEIGVLAIGKCKPSLKCPPHLTVGFSAFFYQLPDEDIPTPYVGTIDMTLSGRPTSGGGGDSGKPASSLPECCGYRLPLKGQLQIMIKNPSCTAIKVFLIPYDFRDMPPNTKTFIRQKSYAITSKSPNYSGPATRRHQDSLTRESSSSTSPSHLLNPDRLKFAIHLHFQMTHKKTLYLTSQMRLVFSPRPLEGDEKLKIVYQAPNFPKYQVLTPLTMTGTSPPPPPPPLQPRPHEAMQHRDFHDHHWQNGGLAASSSSVECVVGQQIHREAPQVQGR